MSRTIYVCPEPGCGAIAEFRCECYGEDDHEMRTTEPLEVVELAQHVAVEKDRDRVRRLFNRLDAALSHHRKGKEGTDGAFADDTDDALHAAHDRILKEAATPEAA